MTSLLQEGIVRSAARHPERDAVVLGAERLTYGEVESLSNALATLLRDQGCRRGDRVCLLVPKSPWAVVSMIAVLKADCIYVPIDLAGPARRVASIVRATSPRVVLVGGRGTRLMDELLGIGIPEATVVSVDEHPQAAVRFEALGSRADWGRLSGSPLAFRNRPDDPAHILFTSGSTGEPKGVVITHANVSRFLAWAIQHFGLGPEDRCSGHAPLHFDLSTFDVFGSLHAGSELHLVPPELNLLPHRMVQFIGEADLTQWFSVPSVLTYMASVDALAGQDLPSLRRLLSCGEVMPTPTLMYFMQHLPHVRYTNLYGPTETTIASSHHTVSSHPTDPTEPIPIGVPCPAERLAVLDGELVPVRPGDVGELFIGGVGLSPGYWRDPIRTREVFVRDPRSDDPTDRLYRTGDLVREGPDGLLRFVGRRDSQIKRRGYRIELGEVEAAVNGAEVVKEAAVVAIPAGGFEAWHICCAYVGRRASSPDELMRGVRERLPSYMLPSRWISLDRLPLNANGKVDRRRLRELFANAETEPQAAMGPAERPRETDIRSIP